MDDFYKGRRVLITGADGFMGSHLTESLFDKGANIFAFIRGTSQVGTYTYKVKNICKLQGKITFIAGDISSPDTIDLIMNARPQIIFHLAANAYVPYSFDHPLEVTNTNLIGTLNVLEAARKLKSAGQTVERIVITSSSEVYGTAQYSPIDENHPLNPTSPYAASKAAADRYAFSYMQTYDLPIAVMRPFNTYGPRHTYDVIPKFIDLALKNSPLTIYGDGRQSRDFTYVTDTINAFLIMGSHPAAEKQFVNFGSGQDYSILEIAKKIKEFSNSTSEIVFVNKRMAEVNRLICSSKKAKQLFGWIPKISLDEGLKRNIEWAKNQ